MEAITLPIYNKHGKEVDSIRLDKEIFDGEINKALLHQAIVAYQTNQRKGLASTKTRGEVSGGGVKPWRQKGTGRARVGSIRSPLWRGGGIIFGPHPRHFSNRLPRQMKKIALKMSLNAKVKENNLIVLDELKFDAAKTKPAAEIFSQPIFRVSDSKRSSKSHRLLLLLSEFDKNSKLSLRNIRFLNFNLAQNIHAYEVLTSKKIVITKEALGQLVKRLKKS